MVFAFNSFGSNGIYKNSAHCSFFENFIQKIVVNQSVRTDGFKQRLWSQQQRTNDQHRTKIPTWDPKFQTCFLPIKNYREPTMGNPKRIFKFRDARSFFPRQTQKFLRYKTQLCHHGRPATDGELLFYRDQRWKFTVPAYLLVAGSHTHSFTTSFWVNRT